MNSVSHRIFNEIIAVKVGITNKFGYVSEHSVNALVFYLLNLSLG